MCVILHLLPGKQAPAEHLFNAAANNWHSWGIGIRLKDKNLKVNRRVPKNGVHTDMKTITKLLEEYKDFERILHFRHNTRGETSLENAHPFLAFKDDTREVYFAHNGTFSKYGDTQSAESDTKAFVDEFLSKALDGWYGRNGWGDYMDQFFQQNILTPGWDRAGGSCRGIIFSNDLPTVRIGTWTAHSAEGHVITDTEVRKDDIAYYASNNQYFRSIDRGPVYEQRKVKEEQERKKKAEEAAKLAASNPVTTPPSNVNYVYNDRSVSRYDAGRFRPEESVFNSLIELFGDIDISNDEDLADLAYTSYEEWNAVVTHFVERNEIPHISVFLEHLTLRFHATMKKLDDYRAKESKQIAETNAKVG